jgi:hypothetical protein
MGYWFWWVQVADSDFVIGKVFIAIELRDLWLQVADCRDFTGKVSIPLELRVLWGRELRDWRAVAPLELVLVKV